MVPDSKLRFLVIELLDEGLLPVPSTQAKWARVAGLTVKDGPIDKNGKDTYWVPCWFEIAVRLEREATKQTMSRMPRELVAQLYNGQVGGRTIRRAKAIVSNKREMTLTITETLLKGDNIDPQIKRAYKGWLKHNT